MSLGSLPLELQWKDALGPAIMTLSWIICGMYGKHDGKSELCGNYFLFLVLVTKIKIGILVQEALQGRTSLVYLSDYNSLLSARIA